MLHIAVESFSLLSVRNVGAWRYWEDDSTETLCFCWSIDHGEVQKWRRGERIPAILAERIRIGEPIGAHNAQFERLAFLKDLSPRLGFPLPKDDQWRCTAAQAAALALPRALDKVAAAIGMTVRKDKRGAQLIKRFCLPRKPTKGDPGIRIYPWEDPLGFEELVEYCAQDVRVERALYDTLPKLSDAEEIVWQLDTRINERGLPIDMDLVDSMIDIATDRLYELEQEAHALTGGLKVTQRDKVLEWLNAEGGDVETLQAKELTDTLAADMLSEIPQNVSRLLEIRLEAGKVSTKKLDKIKQFVSEDNRVRGTLLYHGATPGRWSGKLLQPHNFIRPVHGKNDQERIVDLLRASNVEGATLLYPEPLMVLLGSAMRGVICAPEGKVLNVADYSAIEARALVWEAGQQDAVERYRKNVDQYKIMASHIFNIPVGLIDSAQRKVGKDVILGCGYGMGVDKFVITCDQRGAPVEVKIAEKGVYGFRDLHPMVVKFWRSVENAAIAAVSNPGKIYKVRDIRFYVQDRFLFIQLPSGRRLAYPDPEVGTVKKFGDFKTELTFMGEGKNKQWMRLSTYGGKLVENIVQATARDIMVQGMHNVEAVGYEIISTVHDEIISETEDGFGSVEEYERLLCEMPSWGATCPIAAEGFFAKRWRK